MVLAYPTAWWRTLHVGEEYHLVHVRPANMHRVSTNTK